MPIFRNPMETNNRVMQSIIPLLMKRKQDQDELAYKDKILKLKEDELKAEAADRADKWKRELHKTKVKTLVDLVKGAEGSGDQKAMQTLGPQLENLTNIQLPKERLEGPADQFGNVPLRYLVNPKGGDKPKKFAPKFHFETNDWGDISVFKNGELIKGPGKGKIKTDKKGDEKTKKLDRLASDFMQQIGRSWAAKRGVGQFVPDENKEQVARKAEESAMKIAEQYVRKGGKWGDLGLQKPGQKPPKQEMANMPNASEHKGQVIRDTKTNKRYKSDGNEWKEIQ